MVSTQSCPVILVDHHFEQSCVARIPEGYGYGRINA